MCKLAAWSIQGLIISLLLLAILISIDRARSQQYVTPSVSGNTCAYNTTPLPPLITGSSWNAIQCADACQTAPHTYVPISITTATTTQLVSGTAGKKVYLCYLALSTGVANNVAIIEGTGATCTGTPIGIIGGATAANGVNLAANGSVQYLANFSAVGVTALAADNVCLITSAVGPLSGVAVFAAQ